MDIVLYCFAEFSNVQQLAYFKNDCDIKMHSKSTHTLRAHFQLQYNVLRRLNITYCTCTYTILYYNYTISSLLTTPQLESSWHFPCWLCTGGGGAPRLAFTVVLGVTTGCNVSLSESCGRCPVLSVPVLVKVSEEDAGSLGHNHLRLLVIPLAATAHHWLGLGQWFMVNSRLG